MCLPPRLKHLKRLGFPEGVNIGRGKHFSYDGNAVFDLLIMFEMLQLGISPERAGAIILAFKTRQGAAKWAVEQVRITADSYQIERVIAKYTHSALSNIMEPWNGGYSGDSLTFGQASQFLATILEEEDVPRAMIFDLSAMLENADRHLEKEGWREGYIYDLVWAWCSEYPLNVVHPKA